MLSFAYYVLDKISLLLSLSGKWLQITVRFLTWKVTSQKGIYVCVYALKCYVIIIKFVKNM